MTNAKQYDVVPERDRLASWTAPEIEGAVIRVLTMRFPDWEVSGIRIDEQEARDIASDMILQLHLSFLREPDSQIQ